MIFTGSVGSLAIIQAIAEQAAVARRSIGRLCSRPGRPAVPGRTTGDMRIPGDLVFHARF